MLKQINTEIDVEIEHNETVLKFRMIPVTGSHEHGAATCWETSWSETNIHINLTAAEVVEQVIEQFEHDGQPVPPWAHTDGESILEQIKDHIETHTDVG